MSAVTRKKIKEVAVIEGVTPLEAEEDVSYLTGLPHNTTERIVKVGSSVTVGKSTLYGRERVEVSVWAETSCPLSQKNFVTEALFEENKERAKQQLESLIEAAFPEQK